MWIWRPVGSAEDGLAGWPGDVPALLMDPPVMKAAQEDEVVEVGGPSLCPGDAVVDLQPTGVPAAGMLALAAVSLMDETS